MRSVYAVAASVALFATANAEYWHPAKVTQVVDLPSNGWTPKPTDPPTFHELFKRNSSSDSPTVYLAPDATCGYISGRAGAGYTCYTGYQCVFLTASSVQNSLVQGHVACCDSESCNLRKDCIDYDSLMSSSVCDQGCQEDVYTLKCSASSAPYCNTISFSSDIIDYWCNSFEYSTAQRAYTTFAGESDGRSLTPYVLTSTSSLDFSATDTLQPTISNASAAQPSSTSSSASTSTTGGSGGSSDNNSDNGSGSGKKSTPIGAIVGGVVGGVAAIGIIGLLAFFLLRKKPNNNHQDNNNNNNNTFQGQQPPMQQQPQGFPPPGSQYSSPPTTYSTPHPQSGYYPPQDPSSPGGSQYDPRMSQFGNSPVPTTTTTTSPPPHNFGAAQHNVIHEAPATNQHTGETHELA